MNKSILVVDDERHVRTLLEHTLNPFEEEDVQLNTSASGEEALDLCRQNPPDIIFIDVGMPGMGGYALCDALHSEPCTQHTQIVLMIDMGREPDLTRCNSTRVVDVITKPFDPDRIRLLTGKLLGIHVEL